MDFTKLVQFPPTLITLQSTHCIKSPRSLANDRGKNKKNKGKKEKNSPFNHDSSKVFQTWWITHSILFSKFLDPKDFDIHQKIELRNDPTRKWRDEEGRADYLFTAACSQISADEETRPLVFSFCSHPTQLRTENFPQGKICQCKGTDYTYGF